MTHIKSYIPTAAVILGLMAATSVVAIADDPEPPPGDDLAQVTTIAQEAQDAMAVLDEPRTSADEMPSQVADELGELAKFGMNPDLSRISIGGISNSVYVIPANDHVCVSLTVGEGASMSCAAVEQVANGETGPVMQALDGDAIGIFGIVPDGVESVTVTTGESDSDVVEVEDNAYFVAFPAGTEMHTLSYSGPAGPVEFPLADPAEAFGEE